MHSPDTPERPDAERTPEEVSQPESAADIDAATRDLMSSAEQETSGLARQREHAAHLGENRAESISETGARLIEGRINTATLKSVRMEAGDTPEEAARFVADALQAVGFAARRKLIAGTEKARMLPRESYQNWKSITEFRQIEGALRRLSDPAVREAISNEMKDVTLYFAAENYALPWQLGWNGQELTIARGTKPEASRDTSWNASERPAGWNANREAEYRSQRSQFNPFDAEWGAVETEGRFRAIEPKESLDVPNLAETTLVIQTPRADGQGYDRIDLNAGDRWAVKANGVDVTFRMQTVGTRKNLTILNNGDSAAKIEGHYNMPQRTLTLTLAGAATRDEVDSDKARAIAKAEKLGDRRGEPDRLAQAVGRQEARIQRAEQAPPEEQTDNRNDPMLADAAPASRGNSPFDADRVGSGFDDYRNMENELLATNPLEWKKQQLSKEIEVHAYALEQSYGIQMKPRGDGSFDVHTRLSYEEGTREYNVWQPQGVLSVSSFWLDLVKQQFDKLSLQKDASGKRLDNATKLQKAIASVDARHDTYEYKWNRKAYEKDKVDVHSRNFRTASHVLRDLPNAVPGKYERPTLNKRPKDIESLDRKGGAFAPDLVYNISDIVDPECKTWDLASRRGGKQWDVIAHFAELENGSFELRIASRNDYAASPQSFPAKTFPSFAMLEAYCKNQLRKDIAFDGTQMRANTDLSAPPPPLPTPEQRAAVVASLPPLMEGDERPPEERVKEIRKAVDDLRVASMGVEVPAPAYDIAAYVAALTPEQMGAVFDFNALPFIPWTEVQKDPAAARDGLAYGLHPADANDPHAPMIIDKTAPATFESVFKPWQYSEPDAELVRMAGQNERYQTLLNEYAERRTLVDAYHPTTEENGIRFARSGNTIVYQFSADNAPAVWHGIDNMSDAYMTIGGTVRSVEEAPSQEQDKPLYAYHGRTFDESGNIVAEEQYMTKIDRPEQENTGS